MRYEQLAESIEVVVHFAQSGVQPIRFLWRGKAHKISKVRGRWTTLEGRRQCRHFAVSAANIGNCELTFDLETMIWKIESIAIEN